MAAYILRRLLLMIPTLIGILFVSFLVVQLAPGGPVDEIMNRLSGGADAVGARIGGAGAEDTGYRGGQGLDPALIAELEARFGFDKPPVERFLLMVSSYLRFDFGDSYFQDRAVIDLIAERLPVSIGLGLWTVLIIYLVSIPLGIRKAVRDGSRFDVWTSGIIVLAYAVPAFLFAVLLIVLFAGGSFLQIFPLRGLLSDGWETLPWWRVVLDYFWHLALPLASLVISGFATITLLTKNSFLDEIGKHYVVTARSKGLSETAVLYTHVFRNAMLIVVSGFPGAFVSVFFTGSLLIETIFNLIGMGLLAFESILSRDYAVVFATLYIYALIGLVITLISDLTYVWIDPRIDFSARGA